MSKDPQYKEEKKDETTEAETKKPQKKMRKRKILSILRIYTKGSNGFPSTE
jgi:hypothetical protein